MLLLGCAPGQKLPKTIRTRGQQTEQIPLVSSPLFCSLSLSVLSPSLSLSLLIVSLSEEAFSGISFFARLLIVLSIFKSLRGHFLPFQMESCCFCFQSFLDMSEGDVDSGLPLPSGRQKTMKKYCFLRAKGGRDEDVPCTSLQKPY